MKNILAHHECYQLCFANLLTDDSDSFIVRIRNNKLIFGNARIERKVATIS